MFFFNIPIKTKRFLSGLFSELETLLDNIPDSDSPNKNIARWKADMRHILDTLAEEDYNYLLAMIE